ncbi:MAG: HlyC/CorC family transporter [Armatimonadetes bacterium]|nr:HlyC/CorC family transporter [Armatimonadota bacterium]
MEGDARVTLVVSLLLLVGSAFFVAGEYGLVSARRPKIEALAKKGNRRAAGLLKALESMTTYVAGTQVGITLCGIAIGAVTEPYLHHLIEPGLSFLPSSVVRVLSIIAVALPLVILGELVPKYVALRNPERVALLSAPILRWAGLLLAPLVWLTSRASALILRPFGIRLDQAASDSMSREELAILVKESHEEGHFADSQATVINKALKFDKLDAADVMIHRVDIKWLEKASDRESLPEKLKGIPHSRIPVCSGDIDELDGIVYLQDIVKAWDEPGFTLESVLRPAVFVPENLTLDKVIQRMREDKTQMLIVRDEYGGTAGLLTLEDVVEEVFGELQDTLEGERPPIERMGSTRITARADVRYDEILDFLGFEPGNEPYTTETLAEIVANVLERVPKLGDTVELPIGKLKVENMARSRVTRLVLLLSNRPTAPGA